MRKQPHITANIKGLLKERGVTVKALSEAIKVPERTIYYDFKRGIFKKDLLQKIAFFLGENIYELQRVKTNIAVAEPEPEPLYTPKQESELQTKSKSLIAYLQAENERKNKIIEEKERLIIELLSSKN